MLEADPALAGLPESGEPIFYPKVGHCIYRGVTEDRVAPGMKLLELEDLDEDSRILIPLARVPELNLRPAGLALKDIEEILSAEFEEPIESENERHDLVEKLIADGSPRALAQALKRLHLIRQTSDLTREEELTRKKVRSWLAAEVAISKSCTRAEAQAFMTRMLQDSMAAHLLKQKEEAKERRRAAKAQKKAAKDLARSENEVPVEPLASAVPRELDEPVDNRDSISPDGIASLAETQHPAGEDPE